MLWGLPLYNYCSSALGSPPPPGLLLVRKNICFEQEGLGQGAKKCSCRSLPTRMSGSRIASKILQEWTPLKRVTNLVT